MSAPGDRGALCKGSDTEAEELKFVLPTPELQIQFAASLMDARKFILQGALREAVKNLNISDVDVQLSKHVPAQSLTDLAAQGVRGELVFAVPAILKQNPRLIGYYRLLYGFSQKEFYTAATGFSRFKTMEERGALSSSNEKLLSEACSALCVAGASLLAGVGTSNVGLALLDDLTLLTLGPQLRGGANVRRGVSGIRLVFDAIHEIVRGAVIRVDKSSIELRNAAGKKVLIEFAADPDIIIRMEMRPGKYRQLIAIEVKAGLDFSNIHNRIGEAEKSHQKARANGYVECWTVVNVDKINLVTAQKESPSTSRFYKISDLIAAHGNDYNDFHDRIASLTGI
ncbi:XcyI family restriction endonuclease [Xanthomonas translucens]|uniref:Type-2 restriction enzyme XcyI n=1 Tax=Xanthomonas translucens pv. translucens DSM 18974 TaxID=1261556 RepID=A0A1C3TT46_XANCT|nr:XcyI family restriction endonuclease [Xanthomonas translucens]MCC8445428.1 XcyI family restriction endonuclease [Xanthomonas translucens pv. translucens]CCP39587.1 Type-2 restriction enzyme Cfr9I [Xanthomonas translucens pv. translucens DSM 18974]SCB06403.1 Type-2 restriction enzyme XcyI [Xanthomonas translucens pv. translucens DSM 18974]